MDLEARIRKAVQSLKALKVAVAGCALNEAEIVAWVGRVLEMLEPVLADGHQAIADSK